MIQNDEALKLFLATQDTNVGPRRGPGRRTHEQKEWYSLKAHLLTLATHSLLAYPLAVMKTERPDFLLSDPFGIRGLEVTEATEKDWQRELTETESDTAPALVSNEGWAGDAPESEVSAAILSAIHDKALLRSSYPAPRCDLLIYENCRAGLVINEDRLLRLWQRDFRLSAVQRNAGCFDNISVIVRTHIIHDLLGAAVLLPAVL